MKRLWMSGLLLSLVILFASRASSDVANASDRAIATPEPITGEPAQSAPGSEQPPRDPFSPYDPGPPDSLWPYESLTPAEQAVADRGRHVDGWSQIHDAYATAAAERAKAAAATAAASQLGISDLASAGVVP